METVRRSSRRALSAYRRNHIHWEHSQGIEVLPTLNNLAIVSDAVDDGRPD
jgi:hypothetical protein